MCKKRKPLFSFLFPRQRIGTSAAEFILRPRAVYPAITPAGVVNAQPRLTAELRDVTQVAWQPNITLMVWKGLFNLDTRNTQKCRVFSSKGNKFNFHEKSWRFFILMWKLLSFSSAKTWTEKNKNAGWKRAFWCPRPSLNIKIVIFKSNFCWHIFALCDDNSSVFCVDILMEVSRFVRHNLLYAHCPFFWDKFEFLWAMSSLFSLL